MNVTELIEKLQALPDEYRYLPVVANDSSYGEREITVVEVEVPYTGIGHWLKVSW